MSNTDIDLDFETLLFEKKRITNILLEEIEKYMEIAHLARDFDKERYNLNLGNAFLLLNICEKLLFSPSGIEPEISDYTKLNKLKKFANLNVD
jgi:hypothetical protein